MPAFRNVSLTQFPKRIGLEAPTIHGHDHMWKTNINLQEYHNVKAELEPEDVTFSESSLPPSTSCSPSTSSDTFSSDSSYRCSRVRRRRRDDPNHIPRPRNAFFIFRSCYVNSHLGTGQEPQNQLSKTAAVVWHEMSGKEKAPFYEQALLEKDIHNFEYPGYVYTPIRNGNGNRTKNGKRAGSAQNREDQWSRYWSSESPSPSPGLFTPSPYPDLTSISSLPDNDFVPTSEIPILELSSTHEVSAANLALPPSPFHHHMDSIPYHNESQQYHRCDVSDPTLSPLPRSGISGEIAVRSLSPACSLLCDNPYPSAHYLAAASALSYSSGYEGKHPHFMDTASHLRDSSIIP